MTPFHHTEKHLSQLPALRLLINLGYNYLSPGEAFADERHSKTSNVLLEHTLYKQLSKLNKIRYKGNDYRFSEANIQEAIQKIKNVKYDGLLRTNENVYDLITLGTALEQTLEGDRKSFTLNYIDWKNPANNVFHVVPEYAVERSRSVETARPDIVLFVNGIPLCVIECKAPAVEVEKAVLQNIGNQKDNYIPKLFTYVQLVMAVNKNAAKYATADTPAKFWSIWNESNLIENGELIKDSEAYKELSEIKSGPLPAETKKEIAQTFRCQLPTVDSQLPTPQDAALYCLCRPERLLDLTYRFTLFDAGVKKIARYQQYFVVKSALARIKQRKSDGKRKGGLIWQTQGSGKSLTMVMLARALARDDDITNPRIILVTDREALDEQIANTFAACGASNERATSGRNLVEHLKDKVDIITTLVHKFEKAMASEKFVDDSPDIFVLVDESHRTQFGSMAAIMRHMLPNACYLGFTGTPLLKREKNSITKFDGLIEPQYSIRQAVEDKAVVPLLYEGRHVEMEQNQKAIDRWFERHTSDLTEKQQADLKRKYARAEELNRSDQVIYMRAFDISEHYRKNWQETGFKAQLAAPRRPDALKYHKYLNEIKSVTSAVIISPPNTQEGHEEVGEGSTSEVVRFWNKMIERYGTKDEYFRQTKKQFKNEEKPEILIVVDMLLTGFDAPRNTVLYLCRELREHTLLQAIARVNRLHEGKDFGYIVDYAGVFGELKRALTMYDMYDALEGFDQEDLEGTLALVDEQVGKLPQRHSDLWDVFREVRNKSDEEAFEMQLADAELREEFYECLSKYSKTLGIALSTEKFIMETDAAELKRYKNDLKRFQSLRKAVKLRYAEAVDYRDHEPKIRKLLDTHIQASKVIQLNKPVDIFDDLAVSQVMEYSPIYGSSVRTTRAKADTIAYATRKVIHEKMEEDPAFYKKFSELLQQVIDDSRAHRISDSNYLSEAMGIRDKVVSKRRDDVPATIRDNKEACAYYGSTRQLFEGFHIPIDDTALCELSLTIQKALHDEHKVEFWNDEQAVNRVKGRIDNFFFEELRNKHNIQLNEKQMDAIIDEVMQIARSRRSSRC